VRTRFVNIRLYLAFFTALACAIALPALFPSWKLTFFAPFIIITYYKKPFSACLWLALASGLAMDLLSDQRHLGIHALNYCLTTCILYSQKNNFFEESLSTLPIMTFLFALISTIIQIPLYSLFEKKLPLSGQWLLTDLLLFPLLDAVYGFAAFRLIPFFLPRSPKREYFMD
jgi:rod shape-determining protein MreD